MRMYAYKLHAGRATSAADGEEVRRFCEASIGIA